MKQRDPNRDDLDKELYEAILQLKTAEECRDFFIDLCTPSELEALSDRWQVAQMLIDEVPYRTISEKTGVSVTTVTRVARFLFQGDGGYKRILKRMGKL